MEHPSQPHQPAVPRREDAPQTKVLQNRRVRPNAQWRDILTTIFTGLAQIRKHPCIQSMRFAHMHKRGWVSRQSHINSRSVSGQIRPRGHVTQGQKDSTFYLQFRLLGKGDPVCVAPSLR